MFISQYLLLYNMFVPLEEIILRVLSSLLHLIPDQQEYHFYYY